MKHTLANQTLLVGVNGHALTRESAELYRTLQPGGYVIFSRNIKSPRQLRRLIDDLRDLSEVEPIFAIDQEGGRVSRLAQFGHEPPGAAQLRENGDLHLVRRHGQLTGRLLRLFGLNLGLCPVLDVCPDPRRENSLRGRCYGTTADEVLSLAGTFAEGLHEAGVLNCGKHFPGLAFAEVDPHHDLPVIRRKRQALEEVEWHPFVGLRSQLDSIMTSHAWYPDLDTVETPASLSLHATQQLLREDLQYQGLVLTDDLDMGALVKHYTLPESLDLALRAGNDMLMICHRIDALPVAAKSVQAAPVCELDRALEQIDRFKARLAPPAVFSETAWAGLDADVWQLRVDTLGEAAANKPSEGTASHSPVEDF